MKLITWNCQGAFRKKEHIILELLPDILIVQECEHPERLVFNSKQPNDFLWFGDNQHKGLGVFSFSSLKLKLLNEHNSTFKTIVPILVTGGNFDFTLFAIWANNPEDKYHKYIEQVWRAINFYDQIISDSSIFIGDFNSNKIWDRKHRKGNHSDVVDFLATKNIHSIYHTLLDQEQGKETHPTFFLQRNKDKPYHIDYCFASNKMIDRIQNFEIGDFESWIVHSDHLPVIANFDI
jgi:exonuclease III